MNKKILLDIVGVLLIVLVVLIGYKLSPILLPKADLTIEPDPACDVQKTPCSVAVPELGVLKFSRLCLRRCSWSEQNILPKVQIGRGVS